MSEERKIYDFAGVGQTIDDQVESSIISQKDQPIGIATPVRLSRTNGSLMEMHREMSLQIKDNLRNLIATNHGERLMLHDYGANLLPLAYELGTESADTAAITRITRAVGKYMPYVTLNTFEPIRQSGPDGKVAKVGVRVSFSVPSLQISQQHIEAVVLSVS